MVIPLSISLFSINNWSIKAGRFISIAIEILRNSDKVYIPMPGVGFCLNTSQTANIFLYEAAKQMNLFQEC